MSSALFAQSSRTIELQDGWKLISASKLTESGAAISQPAYATAQWYSIPRMPATVLDILQANKVYPNLYFGMNLLTEVPQDLYQQDWWYRTTFPVPAGGGTFWIDFPGINYRAQIWLNGELVAGDTQVAGMYVDHLLNVTPFIHPGATNVLAVKVTPERLIRNVTGVELADSWFNWINWKYIGYKGPLNIHDLPPLTVTANYAAPGSSEVKSSVATKVTITAASTTSVTLAATVTSGGSPVRAGTLTFMRKDALLGRAPVNADGVATLTIEKPAYSLFDHEGGNGFLPDRNAGIWKPVSLHITGSVKLSNAFVNTDLPLPQTNSASLTVYADVTNSSTGSVHGNLEGEITRPGKPGIHITQPVSLAAGETREVSFSPGNFSQLTVQNPDLWWPYTFGKPALYDLRLTFVENDQVSDMESLRFGIRKVTQHRDHDEQFPEVGKGGNFYLQINGRDFLIRGGAYTPDLLYHDDPKREAVAISYAKDMGLNMLRWESKIASTHMLDLADEAGIPVMYGWMCCDQWEHWNQWNAEDQKVARDSLRSQIRMLRSHASVFIWSNGSDGRAPNPLRDDYHRILTGLHWQNAVLDTVSSYAVDANGDRLWDGIHMEGPYSWRPPSYWFCGRYAPARGSCAEQGDTQIVPPYESLKKFIPSDKLWPINDDWFFHAGASSGVNELLGTRLALDSRYGPSSNAEEFAEKAQLGAYENTRAQFEDFAANGWANHKMTIYWMLNTPWPSFYSGLYDYYLKPGGAYFGAKKGLPPVSVVFDYYATGDHKSAAIRVVNQTLNDQHDLRVRTRVYDLLGHIKYDQQVDHIQVPAQAVSLALTMPSIDNLTSTYFVRCELFTGSGSRLVDNVYWQSTTLDDLGSSSNDKSHSLNQASWANLRALNTMPKVQLQLDGIAGRESIDITLHNPSDHIAFFERVEVTRGKDGEEILPILYNDNYVTVFPDETVKITGTFHQPIGNEKPWLKLVGYNTSKEIAPIK
jgi:exo-1,4-beta-D-glucosaminidase